MVILVTGFSPFGNEEINPSYETVKELPDTLFGATIVKARLTTEFGVSAAELSTLVQIYSPEYIVLVGQAGDRKRISIEKVAINYAQTRGYDQNQVIVNGEIVPNGAAAYFSTLPCEEIVAKINSADIPCELSLSAGSFVCNYIMYMALALYKNKAKVGFVHIPYFPEQTVDKPENTPSMEKEKTVAALKVLIEVLADKLPKNNNKQIES